MTLPIYVINLDRRPDRWRSIFGNLNRIGVTAHRISAIDALSLVPQGNAIMSIGDEACLLSHCKTLNEFLSTSYPAALILEDDAEVADDVPGCLQSTDWWPRTTGLLQLSIFSEKVRLVGSSIGQTPCGRSLHPILSMNGSTAGYLIDRETAQIVLNVCTVPTMPIDHLLFSMKWSPLARRLKPVQINPAMVRQKYSVFASDIAPSRDREHEGWKISRKKMKIWNRRLYKTRVFGLRILGKASRIRIHYSDAHDLGKIVQNTRIGF